jgi:uncharacterized protein (DUF362 family)/Pyruvate/2-oxoacid:ferredoxin oxidoreductase delta subunit
LGKQENTISSSVSLERCGDYESQKVLEAVKNAVDELGGINQYVKAGDRVLLKPNLLVGKRAGRHVNTHPAVVHAAIRLVKDVGGIPVIGDSPALPATGNAVKVAEKCGIADVAKEEGVEVIDFDRPVEVDNPSGTKFKKFKIDKRVLDSDVVINLPKLKSHGQMTLTMGVKNIFGVVPGTRKSQWHLAAGTDRHHFARMLVDLYRNVAPQLTIMDGIMGMEGNGPQNGQPRKIGIIMASDDAVALDAVACEIVGLQRNRMPTTVVAEEMGVGQTRLEEISVLGERLEDCRIADFVFPESSDLMGVFPGFMRNYLRDWLTTRPILDDAACEMCLICAKSCPANAISSRNDTLRFDLKQCIRCFCCQELCPEGAITVGVGPVARLLRL